MMFNYDYDIDYDYIVWVSRVPCLVSRVTKSTS